MIFGQNTVAEFMSARNNETFGIYVGSVAAYCDLMGDILVAPSSAYAKGMHYYEVHSNAYIWHKQQC